MTPAAFQVHFPVTRLCKRNRSLGRAASPCQSHFASISCPTDSRTDHPKEMLLKSGASMSYLRGSKHAVMRTGMRTRGQEKNGLTHRSMQLILLHDTLFWRF